MSGKVMYSENDPGKYNNSTVVIDRDIFKNGYGLYNLQKGEEFSNTYRRLLGINRGFHIINQKYDCPGNKIEVWGHLPENAEDIKKNVFSKL